eukprot:1157584-Pelagomonas_calceolata.AAC.6
MGLRERQHINYANQNIGTGTGTPAWMKASSSKSVGKPNAGQGKARRSLTDDFQLEKAAENKSRPREDEEEEEEELESLQARLARRQPLGGVNANANGGQNQGDWDNRCSYKACHASDLDLEFTMRRLG